MTRAEMTEIFAVLMLAYPYAEMFKAPGKQAVMEKLAPTITLWATCLADVDFWTGQQAAVRVCRVCKFPPTIAEFREQADAVTQRDTGGDRNGLSHGPERVLPEKVHGEEPGGNSGEPAAAGQEGHRGHGRHRRFHPSRRPPVQHAGL